MCQLPSSSLTGWSPKVSRAAKFENVGCCRNQPGRRPGPTTALGLLPAAADQGWAEEQGGQGAVRGQQAGERQQRGGCGELGGGGGNNEGNNSANATRRWKRLDRGEEEEKHKGGREKGRGEGSLASEGTGRRRRRR